MEVLRFVAAVVVVTAAIGVGVFILLSREATGEAQRNAEEVARVQGLAVVEPALSNGLLTGDPAAIAAIDGIVRHRLLDARTVRVKIWDASGRILYSDATPLIGQHFSLGTDELDALQRNLVDSSLSDLTKPENQYERRFGKLLEVYLPIRMPSGQKVLFETYQEFASVESQQQRIMLQFGPMLAGALLLLLLLEVPLAWSMARGLRRAARERESLLGRAVEASQGERRRIARDLHDGVVQRLAGTGMSLAAARQSLETGSNGAAAAVVETLRRDAAEVREAIRELRNLIVKIAPSGLSRETLPQALNDLAEPLRASGIRVDIKTEPCTMDGDQALLIFRVAQEALRNVGRHAAASRVTVEAGPSGSGCALTVSDDGKGFDPSAATGERRDGHLGLALLQTLAEDGGGRLEVTSTPGRGSRIGLTLP